MTPMTLQIVRETGLDCATWVDFSKNMTPFPVGLPPERLEFIDFLRQAMIDHGQVVELMKHQFRFARAGEVFHDKDIPDMDFEPLDSGIFMRAVVTNREGKQVGLKWMQLGYSDHALALLAPYVRPMSDAEIAAVKVGLVAQRVLSRFDHGSARGAGARRQDGCAADEHGRGAYGDRPRG